MSGDIMGRDRTFVRGICVAAGLVFATAALAADGWSTYHNAEFRFSAELPGTPSVTSTPAQTSAGTAPGITGQLQTPGGGALFIGATDYSRLNPSPDLQARLESAVAGAISNSKQTLDSETTITVDGVPGRDIKAHSGSIVSQARLLMTRDRLFMAVGVGLAADGVPAEYSRFAQSLKPD